ncbi:fructosamine kinase family protein [Allokutzneria sp. A3M-2-11 16]|uniref:fructosamine kinase family protein n=1 Tax=Allokutzneria sp. A3M-2-11 16 TaxID=2962043 RepID=UPI0020B7A3AB|nr:fructosamine kinase family protein [Allokutzneria sp. A3M-2-11 16]MCP3801151.1 fructosamine kinase family protein [Allokutzneria sp. A3M-2-11 16]
MIPIGSGASGTVYRAERDGRTVAIKERSTPERNGTWAEAASLTWLGIAVPEVFEWDEDRIVMQYIEPGEPTRESAEELGRALAEIHAQGAAKYGSPPDEGPRDAWIGPVPMRNEECDTWAEFYERFRVEPYVRMAVDRGHLTAKEAEVFDRDWEAPDEPPARVHGDLWNGNVHWGRERAWLIDPAAHGGHRESDLAMLELFGCPHLERVRGAYLEVAPFADGWRDRVGLHQVFPLLVHAAAFGRSYVERALAAARS